MGSDVTAGDVGSAGWRSRLPVGHPLKTRKSHFVFFPEVESDFISASVTMPLETPVEVTEEAVRVLEESGLRLQWEIEEELGTGVIRHVLTSVGDQPFATIAQRNVGNWESSLGAPHLGEVAIELTPSQARSLSSYEVTRRWREMTGAIPGVVELKYTADLIGSPGAIDIQLTGPDIDELRAVADEAKAKLAQYPGVYDVTDSFREGKPEIKLAIRSSAEALGLSLQDLARQVRQGFYGEEAQRIQRGRDDVRVMVRYPRQERRSLGDLESMRVRTPEGAEVPFSSVARAELGRGFAKIRRVDRRRAINVTADVDDEAENSGDILADMEENFLGPLLAKHPTVRYSLEGEQREQMEAMEGLFIGFLGALFVIYTLMAIPFKSYVQPLIVMTAVPFGIVGAVWGHAFMGLALSMLSMCGVVALTGIVVNDSLVLVSYINTNRRANVPLRNAVHDAGSARFRAIILTSLTTAAGVTPLMLEESVQAQFLIPMAAALVFGVLFSTMITLVLVPSGYLILEDFKRAGRWLLGVQKPDRESEQVYAAGSLLGSVAEGPVTEQELSLDGGTYPDDDLDEMVGAGFEAPSTRERGGEGD